MTQDFLISARQARRDVKKRTQKYVTERIDAANAAEVKKDKSLESL